MSNALLAIIVIAVMSSIYAGALAYTFWGTDRIVKKGVTIKKRRRK